MKFNIGLLTIGVGLTLSGVSPAQSNLHSFVRQTYVHGVPYNQAVAFDPRAATPVLVNLLFDAREQDYLANIAVTLGMLGEEQAVEPLIRFIEQAPPAGAALTPAQYVARTSAIMSLGYIVNKTGSPRALAYLRESLRLQVWVERRLNWTGPFDASPDDRNAHLTKMAVLGLGLSGNGAAAEALRSFQAAAALDPAGAIHVKLRDALVEALAANDAIRRTGLAGYYREMDAR
jgi:HEAT repeat protein